MGRVQPRRRWQICWINAWLWTCKGLHVQGVARAGRLVGARTPPLTKAGPIVCSVGVQAEVVIRVPKVDEDFFDEA